jgi:hypothetical protein
MYRAQIIVTIPMCTRHHNDAHTKLITTLCLASAIITCTNAYHFASMIAYKTSDGELRSKLSFRKARELCWKDNCSHHRFYSIYVK